MENQEKKLADRTDSTDPTDTGSVHFGHIGRRPDGTIGFVDQAQSPGEETSPNPFDLDEALRARIAAHPPLVLALREALDGGRYLITVTRKVKDAPPDDLAHREIRVNWPTENTVDALQHISRHILEQERRRIEFEQGAADQKAGWK
jgi:hypothetical protein